MSLAFALTGASLSFAPAVVPVPTSVRAATPTMDIAKDFFSDFAIDTTPVKPWKSTEISNKAGLEKLANELNPIFGYYDPLNIGDKSKETIGWFRHAEIKHGRVAMAGFVGYIVHANGIHFPWHTPGDEQCGTVSAPELWHNLPDAAKLQVVLGIGFLEWWSELRLIPGDKHYMKGGKPGYVPPFDATPDQLPHWIGLNLYDPLKWSMNKTPAQKERGLLVELNNGRAAMLGLLGCLSVSKGCIVPGLDTLPIAPYAGEYMKPFETGFGF
jgi:hypothetical protein